MRVALLTREYPPDVYGGAGVHADELSRGLAALVDVDVHCWGEPRPTTGEGGPRVRVHQAWEVLSGAAPELAALRTMSINLGMVADLDDAELVHSHTWYANLGGHLAKLTYDVPHVVTTHSLEPLRPWKREQLGGGYALSSYCERTGIEGADAIIAVSEGMKADVLASYPAVDPGRVRVIHNGIDTEIHAPDHGTDVLLANGIDPERPTIVFVGRITRQKGVSHLLDAMHHLQGDAQLVLCAGAPDTPQIGAEVAEAVATLQASRGDVVWIDRMVSKREVVQLLTHAAVFVCPSIYEPMGIVNLEAMGCETAVVASAVGGIPEVVVDGETGLLVGFEPGDDDWGSPADPDRFARDLAAAMDELLADPARAAAMGQAGRRRAVGSFSWAAIAERTVALYRELLA